jgi:hypothetical protein
MGALMWCCAASLANALADEATRKETLNTVAGFN